MLAVISTLYSYLYCFCHPSWIIKRSVYFVHLPTRPKSFSQLKYCGAPAHDNIFDNNPAFHIAVANTIEKHTHNIIDNTYFIDNIIVYQRSGYNNLRCLSCYHYLLYSYRISLCWLTIIYINDHFIVQFYSNKSTLVIYWYRLFGNIYLFWRLILI